MQSVRTDEAAERRSLPNRRTELNRRVFTGEDSEQASPVRIDGVDRRLSERRQTTRRASGKNAAAPDAVALICPDCGEPLEYEATLSWILPSTYSVDTGYCAVCSRRFFRTRQTGHYDRHCWAPLCRVCREPVSYAAGTNQRESVRYRCISHPDEAWEYQTLTHRWSALTGSTGC